MVLSANSVGNERGMSIVGMLIVLVILGILIYPGTSPFKETYYNYMAEKQLKDIYGQCGIIWAKDSATLAAAGIVGNLNTEPKECTLETLTSAPYNLRIDRSVEVVVLDSTMQGFNATAKHRNGDKVVRIDNRGKIGS